jgi:anaerobic dimethyl sulfoxide reductase subunit C (anchor subunit)
MRDRSLVAFTLLSQMAVGALWMLGVLRFWVTRQAGLAAAEALITAPLLVAGLLMLLALAASFFHLGSPGRAWRAVANVRSSWLSREILFALLFAGATIILGAMKWFDWGSAALRSAMGGLAALLGLLLLLSMAKAYRLRTVPAWDTWATPATFLMAALLLGGLGAGAMLGLVPGARHEMVRAVQQWIALGAIVLLCMELLVLLLWVMAISAGRGAAWRAATKVTREHGPIFRLRLALAVAAVVVAGAVLAPRAAGDTTGVAIALAFCLVLIAEVLGRVLFYEARVRHGV